MDLPYTAHKLNRNMNYSRQAQLIFKSLYEIVKGIAQSFHDYTIAYNHHFLVNSVLFAGWMLHFLFFNKVFPIIVGHIFIAKHFVI